MKKFLRREDVSERYAVPSSTLYDWIRQGAFPAPVKIGTGHAARWPVEALDAYDAEVSARAADAEA